VSDTAERVSDSDLLLIRLQAAHGDWVGDLYSDLRVMVHSRIADLRRRGYQIECKMFGRGDYRYRLVQKNGGKG
jgi:hypothetical protein